MSRLLTGRLQQGPRMFVAVLTHDIGQRMPMVLRLGMVQAPWQKHQGEEDNGKPLSLNLSQFVEGQIWWTWERAGIEEARLFTRDWLRNGEEMLSFLDQYLRATKCDKLSDTKR